LISSERSQLPCAVHLALGPAVVHAAMIGPIDFYPGVSPARYGPKTGDVIAGQAASRPIRSGLHSELELRLIDAQAACQATSTRKRVTARCSRPGTATSSCNRSA